MKAMRFRRAMRATAMASTLLVVLSACSVLPEAEPVAIYQLPVVRGMAAGQTTSNVAGSTDPTPAGGPAVSGVPALSSIALRVIKPASSAVTDSPRILVLREANQVSAYQAVRWSDPAPTLWRNRLTAAFIDDGRVSALGTDDSPVHADLELGGDLRSFQVEYQGGQPIVALRLDARLIRTGTRRAVGSRSFTVMQPVNGVKVPDVVTAFGQAADALSAQVVDWTLAQSVGTTASGTASSPLPAGVPVRR